MSTKKNALAKLGPSTATKNALAKPSPSTATNEVEARRQAQRYKELLHDPVAGMMIEDLAASYENGRKSARIGVGPDGQPVIYTRDTVLGNEIATAINTATNIRVRGIAEIDYADFQIMKQGATARLRAGDEPVAALPAYEEEHAAPVVESSDELSRLSAKKGEKFWRFDADSAADWVQIRMDLGAEHTQALLMIRGQWSAMLTPEQTWVLTGTDRESQRYQDYLVQQGVDSYDVDSYLTFLLPGSRCPELATAQIPTPLKRENLRSHGGSARPLGPHHQRPSTSPEAP